MSDATGATATQLYVPGFVRNLNLSPQQKTPRLVMGVDADMAYAEKGKAFNADDVGTAEPQPVTARVPKTPDGFVDLSRRVGFFNPFSDARWIDNEDLARQLEDPTNETMQAMMAGLARARDTAIINAAFGAVATGENGQGTPATFPGSQVVAANDRTFVHQNETIPAGTVDYGLSVGKLLRAKALLDQSELEGERFFCGSALALNQLLELTPVTSSFYSSVQALNSGMMNNFLGFTFLRSERLLSQVSSNGGASNVNRRCMAWVKPAIVYKSRSIITARVRTRPDFSDRWQAFYEFDHGAARRYDTGVVEVDVNGA